MKKKKKTNAPKRKRLNRNQRIPEAKVWLPSYNGKNIVKGYSKWFGVDLLCAITELRLIGETISKEYENEVRKSLNAKQKKKKKNKTITNFEDEVYTDLENEFGFAGYTSNGFPYGIRKDELEDEDFNNKYLWD
jgi:hypothetical protein